MSVTLPNNVIISPDILFQDISGETIVLNLAKEQYFGLDDVSTRMWELLNECEDIDGVVAQLLTEFDVDQEVLRTDLAGLIDKLVEAGLVTVP